MPEPGNGIYGQALRARVSGRHGLYHRGGHNLIGEEVWLQWVCGKVGVVGI